MNRMKNSIAIIFILFSLTLHAQTILFDGKNESLLIGEQISYTEDKESIFSPELLEADSQKFISSGQKILNFGFNTSSYWIKFYVQNNSGENILLEVAQALLPEAELFFKDAAGKWQSYKAGYSVNLNEKLIRHHFQLFPIATGGNVYYLRVKTLGNSVPLHLWNEKVYDTKITNQKITYGIYTGILCFVMLYNLFLFFSLGKPGYLHYSSLVFLFAFFVSILEGYITYFIPGINLGHWFILNPIINQPNGLLYSLFFLEARKYSPRLFKYSLYVLAYFLSYILWHNFLPDMKVIPLSQLHALGGIFLMASLGISTGRSGNKLGYYYALAYFIFFVIATIEVIYERTGSPSYLFDLSHVSVAIFIEAFLLAYLLSKRFQWEKTEVENARAEAQQLLLEKIRENEKIVREQNIMLEEKVEERTRELNVAQLQLIQKEKLATLGQLTAGIAHEIRNPLNFINNFAALTRQRLEELITTDDSSEQSELRFEIHQYLEKISHHGRRADDIISGMLLHTRIAGGDRQPSDINLLCEEAINLSYRSVKLKYPGFNCNFKKDLSPDLPVVNVIPNDIERVLLNLVNNALYAVKVKNHPAGSEAEINVSTKIKGREIIISIRDNGNGIPENVLDKIFQPFFTTKPIGDGTGLGLSISNDIIKFHNGNISVKSSPQTGTEFTVALPVS